MYPIFLNSDFEIVCSPNMTPLPLISCLWYWFKNLWHGSDELPDGSQLVLVNSCFITGIKGSNSYEPVNGKRQKLHVPFEEGLHIELLMMLEDLFDGDLLLVLASTTVQGQRRMYVSRHT